MTSTARAVVSPISVAAPTSLDQRQSTDLENVRPSLLGPLLQLTWHWQGLLEHRTAVVVSAD